MRNRELRMLDLGHLNIGSVALIAAGFAAITTAWLYLAWSPQRTLLAWAATIGLQLELAQFQLAVSDLLALPLAVWVVLLMVKRPLTLTGTVGGLLAFAGVFWTFANLVTVLRVGYLPSWAYLNKDVGLIEMLLCVAAVILITDSPAMLRKLLTAFVVGGSVLNTAGLLLAGVSL